MSLKYNLTHPDTIRKAITGGVAAGLAALANAIVEVTADGKVVDPAFHVSSGEWGIVAGAVLAGLTAVYAVKNKTAVPAAEEEVRGGEAEDLPEEDGVHRHEQF